MRRAFTRVRKLLLGLVILEGLLAAPFLVANTEVFTSDELWKLFDKRMVPLYPYEARRAHAQGTGLYRMYINPDGSVRAVGVMKSAGNKSLDLAAAGGLGHCHAKPRGHPLEIDMPVTFTLAPRPRR